MKKVRRMKKALAALVSAALLAGLLPVSALALGGVDGAPHVHGEAGFCNDGYYYTGECVFTPAAPVPETPAPETPAPETPAPETPAPETPVPETPVPETPDDGGNATVSVLGVGHIGADDGLAPDPAARTTEPTEPTEPSEPTEGTWACERYAYYTARFASDAAAESRAVRLVPGYRAATDPLPAYAAAGPWTLDGEEIADLEGLYQAVLAYYEKQEASLFRSAGEPVIEAKGESLLPCYTGELYAGNTMRGWALLSTVFRDFAAFTTGNFTTSNHVAGPIAVGGNATIHGINAGLDLSGKPSAVMGTLAIEGNNAFGGMGSLYVNSDQITVTSHVGRGWTYTDLMGAAHTIDLGNDGMWAAPKFVAFDAISSALRGVSQSLAATGGAVDVENGDFVNLPQGITFVTAWEGRELFTIPAGARITVTKAAYEKIKAINITGDVKSGATVITVLGDNPAVKDIYLNAEDGEVYSYSYTESKIWDTLATDYGGAHMGLVWNFPEADSVALNQDSDFLGHILAPDANVTREKGGNIDGTVIAASLTLRGACELHAWGPPTSEPTIPEEPKTSALTIQKSFAGDPVTPPEELKLTVTGPDGDTKTLTLSDEDVAVSKDRATYTWTLKNLALGNYTVAEAGAEVEGYLLKAEALPAGGSVTLDAVKDTGAVYFTNTYTKVLGELIIQKIFAGDPVTPPEELKLAVTGPDGYTKTLTLSDEDVAVSKDRATYTWTLKNLALGNYTVAEAGAEVEGYQLVTGFLPANPDLEGNTVRVDLEKNSNTEEPGIVTVPVYLTNTYQTATTPTPPPTPPTPPPTTPTPPPTTPTPPPTTPTPPPTTPTAPPTTDTDDDDRTPPEVEIRDDEIPLNPTPAGPDDPRPPRGREAEELVELPEQPVPLAPAPPEEILILDEDVPLGDLPQTGAVAGPADPTATLCGLALAFSAAALGLFFAIGRKKDEEDT